MVEEVIHDPLVLHWQDSKAQQSATTVDEVGAQRRSK
jgi:hypothetical protein